MTREEAIKELKKVNTLDMPVRLCEAYYMSIEALEQEPCEDAISRQAMLDLISKFIHEIHTEGGRDLNAHTNDVLRQILRNVGSDRVLPSINPQEPFKPMVEIDLYSVIKQKYIEREVLDKIRAEIANIPITDSDGHYNNWYRESQAIINDVLQIIDKYTAESEDKE